MLKIKGLFNEMRRKETADPVTGQPLFRPNIISQPQNRHRGGKSIGEYLFEMSKNKVHQEPPKSKLQVDPNSEVILRNMQARRVAWLFSELDSDQDGRISSDKICIDSIPERVLEVIMPILFEMEDLQVELSIDEFQVAVQSLHRCLTS